MIAEPQRHLDSNRVSLFVADYEVLTSVAQLNSTNDYDEDGVRRLLTPMLP
jgi:hypothetical protein